MTLQYPLLRAVEWPVKYHRTVAAMALDPISSLSL